MRSLLSLLLFFSTAVMAQGEWLAKQPVAQQSRHWQWQDLDGQHWLKPDRVDNPTPLLFIYSKPSSAYDTALVEVLRALYANRQARPIHVINDRLEPGQVEQLIRSERYAAGFVAGSRATMRLADQASELSFPLVSVTAKDPVLLGLASHYGADGTPFVFTSLNLRTETLVRYLQLLNPELKNIAVLYGAENRSARITQAEPLQQEAEKQGINVQLLGIPKQTIEQQLPLMMQQAVNDMRSRDPELKNSLFWITGSSSLFPRMELINRAAGPVAVLSTVPELVTSRPSSAMASIGVSFVTNARLAADFAIRILQGEPAGEMVVGVVEPPDVVINFSKVEQMGWSIPFPLFELASRLINQRGEVVEEAMAMAAPAP